MPLKLSTPLISSVIIFIWLLLRSIYFSFASDDELIAIIPDDAFYYIQLAKHRLEHGFWTFDGTSKASGFHLLYGYFLVGIFYIFPDANWRDLYLPISLLSTFFIAAGCYLSATVTKKLFNDYSSLFVLAIFFTISVLNQGTGMMESMFVIPLAAMSIYFVAKTATLKANEIFIIFLIGLCGSLARSDFGLLPGMLFVCCVFSYPWLKNNQIWRSSILLSGAIAGVLIVLLHNLISTGAMAQASAAVKLHWSETIGHTIYPSLQLLLKSLLPYLQSFSVPIQALFVIAFCPLILWRLLHYLKLEQKEQIIYALRIVIACLLTIVGYMVFYRHNSQAIQVWYIANFIVPLCVVFAATGYILFRNKTLIAGIIISLTHFAFAAPKTFSLIWPHQAGMMNAGLFLKNQPENYKYAAWNAGIISYFSQKPVINIDGLTNNDIYPYIKSNKLYDYLVKEDVNFIADYEFMFSHIHMPIRGGYDDEKILNCITVAKPNIDNGAPAMAETQINLYKVTKDCKKQ